LEQNAQVAQVLRNNFLKDWPKLWGSSSGPVGGSGAVSKTFTSARKKMTANALKPGCHLSQLAGITPVQKRLWRIASHT